ncbi:MAG: LPS export ABC transporter permease LptG [Pseudomonadota bacterium]
MNKQGNKSATADTNQSAGADSSVADLSVNGVFVRYVGKMFATRCLGLLVFFVIILQMLDLLNNSTEIYEADGADWRSIVKYIALRGPQIASQFAPFAALLGVVATLSSLNQRSEITIMRSAGMSGQRVLQPIGVVCCGLVFAHFVFHELVVVRSTGALAYWEANDYAVDLPTQQETRTDLRFANGNELISAASASRDGDSTVLSDVVIYGLDETGLAKTVEEARTATFREEAWALRNVRTLSIEDESVAVAREKAWNTTLDPAILFALTLKADRTGIPNLLRQVSELRRNNADTSDEMTSLLARISKPLSTLLMPLLGAIAGYGVARAGTQLIRAAAGATIGFAYFITENLFVALGKLGTVPAFIGAFFPLALFLLLGIAILSTVDN